MARIITFREAVNEALLQEMERDPKVIAMGEDVIGGSGALALPVGSDANRPGGPLQGSVRYNTDRNQFEGYNGIAWSSLGGVRDVDNDTYIIPEVSAGSDEDRLDFYTVDRNFGKAGFESLVNFSDHNLSFIFVFQREIKVK